MFKRAVNAVSDAIVWTPSSNWWTVPAHSMKMMVNNNLLMLAFTVHHKTSLKKLEG